jgi:hypothetical protein
MLVIIKWASVIPAVQRETDREPIHGNRTAALPVRESENVANY